MVPQRAFIFSHGGNYKNDRNKAENKIILMKFTVSTMKCYIHFQSVTVLYIYPSIK